MAGGLHGLRKRLANVEQGLATIAKQEGVSNCICSPATLALPDQPEEFEAEMNRKCPVHGFRRLGTIMRVRFVEADGTIVESPKLDQLLETYEARLSRTCKP